MSEYGHGFSDALLFLEDGEAVTREKWKGTRLKIRIRRGDHGGDHLVLCRDEAQVKWTITQEDVMARDWGIADE